MSRYESCVTDADGRCTRWGHDHDDQPPARIRAERTAEHDTNGDDQ